MKNYKILVLIIVLAALIGGIVFFTNSSPSASTDNAPAIIQENQLEEMKDSDQTTEQSNWLTTELTDINSGEKFTIQSLKEMGKPIILESFAVWCPVCNKQQGYIKELHTQEGYSENEVFSINLNTDPNEDELRVRDHLKGKGYNWRYAISTSEVTQSLVDEFGPGIVNAPSAPVIIICPDGDRFKVSKNGAKDLEELKAELAKC